MARTRRHPTNVGSFTYSELKILWYLKRGPLMVKDTTPTGGRGPKISLLNRLALDLEMSVSSVSYNLKNLEDRCLILRTYKGERAGNFVSDKGYNPLVKVELVDPDIHLPELPKISLGVVLAHENEDLLVRTEHEPSYEDVMMALVDRIQELQVNVDKLQDALIKSSEENERLKKDVAEVKRPPRTHLSDPVRNALTKEKWDELKHRG